MKVLGVVVIGLYASIASADLTTLELVQYREAMDLTIAEDGTDGQACWTDGRATMCAFDSLTRPSIVEIGDPHDPAGELDFCTVAFDGSVGTCKRPPEGFECHAGFCWCVDGPDCIKMIKALVCNIGTYKPNPGPDPGASCYSH